MSIVALCSASLRLGKHGTFCFNIISILEPPIIVLASQVRAPWLARASGRGRTRGESRAAVQAVSCETRLHWGEWVIQPTVLEL